MAALIGLSRGLGDPVFMTPEHVARIATRPDEAHRRRVLDL
jgi:hypothetical protein